MMDGSKRATSMSENSNHYRIFWISLEMFSRCRENLREMGFEKP